MKMAKKKEKNGMAMMHAFLAMFFLVPLTQGMSLPSQSNEFRLSHDVIPNSYDITLFPDMDAEKFIFSGQSVINITFLKPTNKINLHSKNLELIDPIELQCDSEKHNLPTSEYNAKNNILSLNIPKEMNIRIGSPCYLTMKFKGGDGELRTGFFRTQYTNARGEKKYIAFTNLRPYNTARQVFPCWDEPGFKANFTISVKHSLKYGVLSNMHAVASEVDEHRTMKITRFAESPKMFPHSIFLVISHLVKVNGSDLEVWTPENNFRPGKFVEQYGPKILEILERYLDFSYEEQGFSKSQLLAMLKVFTEIIEMENLGLIRSYSFKHESDWFIDDFDSTSHEKYILKTITREFLSLWLDNFIADDRWHDEYLKKGFGSYFEYFIINQIKPTWRMMDMFVVDNLQNWAFPYDIRDFESPDDLYGAKRSCIIRMISHVVGEEQFRTALQNFIKNNAFGTVTSNDFIEELENVADTNTPNLPEIIRNWITEPGHPVLNIAREYTDGTAVISQARFIRPNMKVHKSKYWIPLNYVTRSDLSFSDTSVTDWLDPNANSKTIKLNNQNDFVIFNKQQFGYYRVNYDRKNWEMIIEYLKSENYTNIHVLNRAQLIDDAFNLANINQLEYDIVVSLLEYLKKETDIVPWRAAWRGLRFILQHVKNTDFEETFKSRVLELSTKLVTEVLSIPQNTSDHIMKSKRTEALKWACKFGSKSCQSEATEKFNKWLTDPKTNTLDPEDEDWIMCSGIQNNNQTMWNKLWEIYLNGNNERILYALGCTSNPSILNEYLAKVIEGNQTEILWTVADAVHRGSSYGVDFLLDFMIEKNYPIRESPDHKHIDPVAVFSTLEMTNEEQFNKLEKYMNEKGKNLVNENFASLFIRSMREHVDEIITRRKSFINATIHNYD